MWFLNVGSFCLYAVNVRFCGSEYGCRQSEKGKKALFCGIASSLTVSIAMAYFTFSHGDLLAGIFAKDTTIILPAADYLKAYALDFLLTSFLFCFIGYFNGCSQTTFVMLQGIIGAFCVRIPVSWFMSRQAEVSLFHIGLATPASSIVQIALCIGYLMYFTHKQKSKANLINYI